MLALEGDPGAGMFILCEGTSRSSSARQPRAGPGDFFGELALLVDDGARVARVRATSPVRCVSIPREEFLTLVETEPSFALHMLASSRAASPRPARLSERQGAPPGRGYDRAVSGTKTIAENRRARTTTTSSSGSRPASS